MRNFKRRLMVLVTCAAVAGLVSCAPFLPIIKDAATRLGQCLAGAGVSSADSLVQQWVNGETIHARDIGWTALANALPCFAQAGAFIVGGMLSTPTTDSIGATASRSLRLLGTFDDPLTAACGTGPTPDCDIVLFTREGGR